MSQCEQILEMLKHGPVTAIDALEACGCFRLAARINDLRAQGHNIQTEMVHEGEKQFARYHLITKEETCTSE